MGWLDPLLVAAFTLLDTPVSWLEMAAFALSLWMVSCNIRVDPLAWPLAIAASLLYGLLFLSSKLYGEAGLQLFFVAIAGWGWWQWRFGTQAGGAPLAVRAMGWRQLGAVTAVALLAWPLLGLLLDQATDSDVPYFDAFPTALSVAGQWLLGRKYIENWPTWVLVNVVSVGLFASKGLWLTALLYALFALLALAGWRAWNRLGASARDGALRS